MKAFVIKNKEGKYLGVSSNNYEHYWTTIDFAHYFRFLSGTHDAKQEAEEFRDGRYPDCEVVEITIAEGDLEKEIEHWHNLFKQKEQQFQSVRERYHLLNRLQANYDKKHKLHLSEMQCLELVEKNEKLEQKNKQLKERIQNILEGKEIPAICAKKYEEYEEQLAITEKALKLKIMSCLFDFDYENQEEIDNSIMENYNLFIEQAKENLK